MRGEIFVDLQLPERRIGVGGRCIRERAGQLFGKGTDKPDVERAKEKGRVGLSTQSVRGQLVPDGEQQAAQKIAVRVGADQGCVDGGEDRCTRVVDGFCIPFRFAVARQHLKPDGELVSGTDAMEKARWDQADRTGRQRPLDMVGSFQSQRVVHGGEQLIVRMGMEIRGDGIVADKSGIEDGRNGRVVDRCGENGVHRRLLSRRSGIGTEKVYHKSPVDARGGIDRASCTQKRKPVRDKLPFSIGGYLWITDSSSLLRRRRQPQR